MTDRDKIIEELKKLNLTEKQFEEALERRLFALKHQRSRPRCDDDGDYCSSCVL